MKETVREGKGREEENPLTFDHMAALDDVRVRMVDGHVKAQGLQQDVFVAHKLLGLGGK